SIPNIWYFADTDGDDKADVREVLFGPLGYEKDTHGMCSSFRLGLDGWVYATHGFNNTSHFKAKDGSTLDLHSGNVFRFKPDGSRVEPWTWGQVNPFGLAWDRYGNLYSADCHSSPIYQLIRGAYYPSFGKPHDGLGFAPVMCEHSHGSTGICGIVYIDGGVWGPEWDDHTFVGNVVTSRVNHDKVTFTGSTPKANEQPDFITSDDLWFRPVDLQLGPDNALYIADFYNKIIGHYEVPLDHPQRDKERGRIWRVVKKGTKALPNDFTAMPAKEIADELGNPNLTRRHLALREVRRRGSREWLPEFTSIFEPEEFGAPTKFTPMGDRTPKGFTGNDPSDFPNEKVFCIKRNLRSAHTLWALSYLGERFAVSCEMRALHTGGVWVEDQRDDAGVLIPDNQYGLVMSHAAQIIGNYEPLHPWEKWNLSIVFDSRGSAAGRAVTQTMLHRPDLMDVDDVWRRYTLEWMTRLIDNLLSPPGRDTPRTYELGDDAYVYSLQLLLRDYLSRPGVLEDPEAQNWNERVVNKAWFVDVIKAVPTASASAFLFQHAKSLERIPPDILTHIARHGDDELVQALLRQEHARANASLADQVELIQSIHNGLSERGAPANAELLQWAQELATQLLTQTNNRPEPAWISTATADNGPKWSLQTRKCADGTEAQVLQSMIKGGGDEERRAGVLKSKTFAAPAKLTFWINGHRGPPKAEVHDKNLVRVVDAKSGETLASVFPPRNDVCQRAEFDLSKHAAETVRLEIVDGDDGKAYAWLGVTRIEPAVVSVNDFQTEDSTRDALKTLAVMLQHTAPAALREKLSGYLPPRHAPPPLPVSPAQRKQLDALIATRAASFAKAKPDATAGKTLFKTHCAVCHRIGGEGGLIGPQLDGIGARGVERLCEDILDPNRNVDAHFHLHTLTLKDGTTMSGFLKGEAGQVLILADAAGQEHRVSKNDLAKDETTPMSLMPPVFGQTLDEEAFINLLGYLLSENTGK
ncbi:c-type cytochrome, partial [Prosthecobacter sp.]|uniref:DUF7133 domain-containing protein n=1 Tax=Prosthecobacter sp. TaxID=1965333 RepID=UPI001D3F647C